MEEKNCKVTSIINEYEFNRNNEYCVYNNTELREMLIKDLKILIT